MASNSSKKQDLLSRFSKKKDEDSSSSTTISHAASPAPLPLSPTSTSTASTSDLVFESQDALSIADTILEIGKGVGEIAGPASGPLKAACGILQTLVRAAKQIRQNGINLQELIEKLNKQSDFLEKQYQKYSASPFSSENAAESEFYEAFQIYFSDLQAVGHALDQLVHRDDSGIRKLIRNAAAIDSTKEIINSCVRKLDDFYQRFTTSIEVSSQVKLEEMNARLVLNNLSVAKPKQNHQQCLKDTRMAILQEIRNWATDSHSQPMFALVDQAGTGKSTIATTMMKEWEGRRLGARFYFTKPSIVTAEKLASSLAKGLADRSLRIRRQIIASIEKHTDYVNDNISDQLEFLVFTPLQEETQALTDALEAVHKEKREKQVMESWSVLKEKDGVVSYVMRPRYMIDVNHVRKASKAYLEALGKLRTMGRSEVRVKELEDMYVQYLDAQEKAILETLGRPPILVIDALDECSVDDRKLVLNSILKSLSTPPTFKIFLTCRPESDIYKRIKERTNVICRPTHLLLSKEYQPEQDISIYAEHHLKGRLSPSQITQFIERAGGLFIWAATAEKFLDVSEGLVSVRFNILMQSSPKNSALHKLYYEVLSAVVEEYGEEEDLVKEILKAIAISREPLTPCSMVDLLRLSYKPAEVAGIVGSLRSVLLGGSEDEPVYTLHPTFIEYLQAGSKPGGLEFSLEEVNTQFALGCLSRLSKDLEHDICKVVTTENPTPLNSEIKNLSKLIETNTSPALRYAAIHGLSHIQLCLSDILVVRELRLFFQRKLLYWIELMCLLGKFLECVQSVRFLKIRIKEMLEEVKRQCSQKDEQASSAWPFMGSLRALTVRTVEILQGVEGKNTRKDDDVILEDVQWCDEIISMVQPFQNTIEGSAMQVCYSALPFVPSDAVIYKHLHQQCQIPIPIVLRGTARPSNQPTVLSGHRDFVRCLAFSPNGKRLASGSRDNNLCLWDAEAGAAVGAPLQGHGDWINCLAFSPDGRRLASGSYDGTIRLWNGETGTAVGGPLKGHRGSVSCLTFFLDGKRLASGSEDSTIRLWDGKTGAVVGAPLEGHFYPVNCIAASPNGKQLVSGSMDKTFRLWDGETGAAVGRPVSNDQSVESLRFYLQEEIPLLAVNKTDVYNMTTDPPSLSSSSTPSEISISYDKSWTHVHANGRRFRFKLPPHYSVEEYCTLQGRIAFGGLDGSVVIIDCSPLL